MKGTLHVQIEPGISRVDTETLHLLAWFSSLDLCTLLERLQREQSWKRPRQLLEQLLQTRLEEALACFQHDQLFGPLLACLVRFRTERVDLATLAAAYSISDLVEPSFALFYSDQPYRSLLITDKGEDRPANETQAFSQAVSSQPSLTEFLEMWSTSWEGDVCQGARAMQHFFTSYPRYVPTLLEAPFFIRSFLAMSLN